MLTSLALVFLLGLAAAALCSRDFPEIPCLVAEDSRKALGEIARQERLRLETEVRILGEE